MLFIGAFLVTLAAGIFAGRGKSRVAETIAGLSLVAGNICLAGAAASVILGWAPWVGLLVLPGLMVGGVALGILVKHVASAVKHALDEPEEQANPDELAPVPINVTLRPGRTPDDVLDDLRRGGPGQ